MKAASCVSVKTSVFTHEAVVRGNLQTDHFCLAHKHSALYRYNQEDWTTTRAGAMTSFSPLNDVMAFTLKLLADTVLLQVWFWPRFHADDRALQSLNEANVGVRLSYCITAAALVAARYLMVSAILMLSFFLSSVRRLMKYRKSSPQQKTLPTAPSSTSLLSSDAAVAMALWISFIT